MTAQEQTSTPQTWQEVLALHLTQRLVQWVRQDRHTPLVETLLARLQGMMQSLPFCAGLVRRYKAAEAVATRQRPSISMQPVALALEADPPEPHPLPGNSEIPAALPSPRPLEVLPAAPPPTGSLPSPGGRSSGREPVWMTSPASHTGPPPPRPVVLIHHHHYQQEQERFPANRSSAAILQQRLGAIPGSRGTSREVSKPPPR